MINLDVNVNMENLQGILGVMVPIVAIAGGLSLSFAIRYLKSKERMEMISRGMDPASLEAMDRADEQKPVKQKRSPLRFGLVSLGGGLGVMIAYILCHTIIHAADVEFVYLGMTAIFVGLALVLSHILEKKEPEEKNQAL